MSMPLLSRDGRINIGQDGSMIVVLEANSEEELKGLPVLDSHMKS